MSPIAPQAPFSKSVLEQTIREHPEIDRMDEDSPSGRARILDYAIKKLNKGRDPLTGPWGRKARRRIDSEDPATGVDLNTDGLTYLRPDGRFEIIDAISGTDGSATWDHHGVFEQGANGFWAPGLPVDDERPKPGPVPRPQPPTDPMLPAPERGFLDYSGMLKLTSEIAVVLERGTGRGNPRMIGEVIGHLLWKVTREGYPVQAAIDNANRRARGEVAD